ncbi:MAG: hypothetical protein WHU10_11815 [Fimbriimonadales bacterium]
MKRIGLAGALILAVVALVVAIYSGYRSLSGPKADPDRFPKPPPEVMEQIQQMQQNAPPQGR